MRRTAGPSLGPYWPVLQPEDRRQIAPASHDAGFHLRDEKDPRLKLRHEQQQAAAFKTAVLLTLALFSLHLYVGSVLLPEQPERQVGERGRGPRRYSQVSREQQTEKRSERGSEPSG